MTHSKQEILAKVATIMELVDYDTSTSPGIWSCRQLPSTITLRCMDSDLEDKPRLELPFQQSGALTFESEHASVLDHPAHESICILQTSSHDADQIEIKGRVVDLIEEGLTPKIWVIDCGLRLLILEAPETTDTGPLVVGAHVRVRGFLVLDLFGLKYSSTKRSDA